MHLILIDDNSKLEYLVDIERSQDSPETILIELEDALLSGDLSESEVCDIITDLFRSKS